MGLLHRNIEWRPDPEPMSVDGRPAVVLGTLVWAVLLVIAILRRGDLAAEGHSWWVWTPVVGIALGLLGMVVLRRQAESGATDPDQQPGPTPPAAGTTPDRHP